MEVNVDYHLQEDDTEWEPTKGFRKTKLLYSFPSFSLISLTVLINVQVFIFYNEIGVSLAFLSFFQICARSFDVLTDPLMAHISDNLTRTKYGRRIPWMFFGGPFYAISFFILMSPPTTYNSNKYEYNYPATYWFGISYILFYLFDTIANIPLFALGPELSNKPDERISLFMWVKIFEGMGTISGGILPLICISFFKLTKTFSFKLLALIFGGWYIISLFLIIKFVSERKNSSIQKKTPFIAAIYRSFRNRAFKPLAIGWILDFSALAIIASVLPFFIRYSLESLHPDITLNISVVVLFGFSFISIPFWKYISNRGNQFYFLGKRNAWIFYNLLMCFTNFLLIFIGKQQDILFIILMAINGIPLGGQFLILSILSDVIDYDEFLNFTRNEGAFTTFSTFIPKLVAIPAQSIPLIILFMLGFKNPKQHDNSDDSDNIIFYEQNYKVKIFLRIMFAVIPSIISAISFIIKWKYFPIKNNEIMKQITDGIVKHKESLSAIDPLTKISVSISEHNDDEQIIIDLLDHFSYSYLMTLCKGMENGIHKIQKKLSFWVIFGIIAVAISIIGVITSIHLLNDVHYAFIPALFCLFIGSSIVFIAFNLLRFRAINKLKRYYIESQLNDKIDITDLLKKFYYPKIKPQNNNKIQYEMNSLM